MNRVLNIADALRGITGRRIAFTQHNEVLDNNNNGRTVAEVLTLTLDNGATVRIESAAEFEPSWLEITLEEA